MKVIRLTTRHFFSTLTDAAHLGLGAMSYSRYKTPGHRANLLAEFHRATVPLLPWYSVVSLLMILVIVRLVVVTAESYDLTQYSLQVLIRTLVLELIPIFAALMVALRYALPRCQQIDGDHEPHLVMAGALAMVLFTLLSCVFGLVVSYLMVFGLTPWGLPSYTHHVGRIFLPDTTLVFAAKTFLFCIAVTLIPVLSRRGLGAKGFSEEEVSLHSLTRVFIGLLVIEVIALVAIYF
jgi:phospholipid/cholesterol/gamma-HCH transport system permease protein